MPWGGSVVGRCRARVVILLASWWLASSPLGAQEPAEKVPADAGETGKPDPEPVRRSEDVAVVAPAGESAAPGARLLEGPELEGLAGVLVDDPLRSVHSLPG